MKLKKARQILKTFADDTRLRIINLLNHHTLAVNEICEILDKTQPNISKHLTRLRLTEIVSDKRKGLNVCCFLLKSESKIHRELLSAIIVGLSDLEIFKNDLERLKRLYPSKKHSKKSK